VAADDNRSPRLNSYLQAIEQPLTTLDELHDFASTAGITIPERITTAS